MVLILKSMPVKQKLAQIKLLRAQVRVILHWNWTEDEFSFTGIKQ